MSNFFLLEAAENIVFGFASLTVIIVSNLLSVFLYLQGDTLEAPKVYNFEGVSS